MMGCFSTAPHVFGIAGDGLVVLAGVSDSLTVIITALQLQSLPSLWLALCFVEMPFFLVLFSLPYLYISAY